MSNTFITERQWADEVLEDLGAPVTTNNEDNILKWMTAEEPTSNWYDRDNPLNASLDTDSTSGLGSYPNLATAAQETAAMIEQNNMMGIDEALQENASADTFSTAVVDSPWASSHYGGNPLAIANITTPSGTVLSNSAPGIVLDSEVTPAQGTTDGLTSGIGSAIGSGAASSVESLFGISGGQGLMTRILLGIIALIFLIIGLDKLFDSNASPADILVSGTQSVPQAATTANRKLSSGKPKEADKPVFSRGKHVAKDAAGAAIVAG